MLNSLLSGLPPDSHLIGEGPERPDVDGRLVGDDGGVAALHYLLVRAREVRARAPHQPLLASNTCLTCEGKQWMFSLRDRIQLWYVSQDF